MQPAPDMVVTVLDQISTRIFADGADLDGVLRLVFADKAREMRGRCLDARQPAPHRGAGAAQLQVDGAYANEYA
jgi:hypothetical protein